MQIKELGRAEHRALSAAITNALKKVGDDFGVDLVAGGGTLGAGTGVIKVAVTIRNTSAGVSGAEMDYKRYAGYLRMPPDGYGKQVKIGNQLFRIVGLNPSAPKNCVELQRVIDGKSFKCPRESVIGQLTTAKAA